MRAVLALLLLLTAAVSRAQDGGTPDGGAVELDFPSFLRGGSEAAAGLDVAAAGEIVHPSNPAALVASLRNAGAVLEGGQKSFVLQFNPYLLSQGYEQLYPEALAARKARFTRYLQDSALTLALAEDTPYEDVTLEEGRFATVMAGAAVDVFGERSIYGEFYSTCVNTLMADPSLYDFPDSPLEDEFKNAAGEVDRAAYDKAVAGHPAAMEAARQAGIDKLRLGLTGCARQVRQASTALFVSAGGRWVMPGLKRQDGDGVAIQRGFAGATLELLSGGDASVEAALQLRALYERQSPGVPMGKWLDAGFSVGVASPRFQLKVEATQSFAKLEDTDTKRASVVATSRIVVVDNVTVGIGVQGTGEDLSDALGQLRPSLVFNFADLPTVLQPVPKPPG
ncbi:hypothetical protein [Pyxidicoccus xibeiensis]|uniref:hypothetical protein n=1 Tax=Pyxidicoccus xibeiensis TaxID=2906759 RepID=UPI0020A71C83|nr:hypothetical protein [Pyxidicoccus xibeiensis]MCP3137205.1 hypothetical protein [Pyxidicoccus xibeiensis]